MMGDFTTWAGALRWALIGTLSLGTAACADDEPEHTYETGIEPTSGNEQADSPGVDEAEAVEIAMALAEQEGYDTQSYSDIVVDHHDDANWVVQLRRPRMLRFLEVTVDKVSGESSLRVRSSGADG